MIYSITFELKSDPSTSQRQVSTLIWAKSKDEPTLDKVRAVVESRFVKGGEERDEKEIQKGARLYDLDEEWNMSGLYRRRFST